MDEVEKFFRCPFCRERISMLLDVSVSGQQTYIEDCEVCCQPIQVNYMAMEGVLEIFSATGSG